MRGLKLDFIGMLKTAFESNGEDNQKIKRERNFDMPLQHSAATKLVTEQ